MKKYTATLKLGDTFIITTFYAENKKDAKIIAAEKLDLRIRKEQKDDNR